MKQTKNFYSIKKRIISAFAATVLLLSVFTGCSIEPQTETKTAAEAFKNIQAQLQQEHTGDGEEAFDPSGIRKTLGINQGFGRVLPVPSAQFESLFDEIDGGIVYDVSGGYVMYSKDADKRVYPASLTKLVTTATAVKYSSLDEVFTVGSELSLVHENSSLCLIQEGQQLKLKDLICGMLISSGNDAAYTVALNIARSVWPDTEMSDTEAVAKFCGLMNDTAREIGMENSFFTSPDGWDDDNQYTTAEDMLKAALYVMKIDEVREAVKCSQKYVQFESGETITWKNTNLLLNENSSLYYPYATGIKTGTTAKAGNCLVASAEKDGKEAMIVEMNCEDGEQRFIIAASVFKSILGD